MADEYKGVDLYEVLGLEAGADEKEVARAYKKKSLLHHPDRGGEGAWLSLGVVYSLSSDSWRFQSRHFSSSSTRETSSWTRSRRASMTKSSHMSSWRASASLSARPS
jgi:hypothetical protein